MERESYNFKLNTSMLGWPKMQNNYSIQVLPYAPAVNMSNSDLESRGISGILNAYEYRVYKIEAGK